jgi:exonuclease SbcC
MRPHVLRFAGIGPYPQAVEIDFDRLNTLGLYLIVGPTGAGKSTIFDAMTYALYGKVAGDRPENGLVSDHEGRQSPIVELEFSHRDKRYVVHRELSVDGRQIPPSRQWVRELSAQGKEVRTVTGIMPINQYVQDLIGLDASQFMKVILLPQSKFQEFLLANSRDRQPLLQKLFGTSLYFEIGQKLKTNAQEMLDRARDAATQLTAERHSTLQVVENLLDQNLVKDLPDVEEHLGQVIVSLTQSTAEAQKAAAVAQESFGLAAKKLATAQNEAERFDAALELKDERKESAKLRDRVLKAKDSLAKAERANRVAIQINAVESAQLKLQDSQYASDETRREITRNLKEMKAGSLFESVSSVVPSASSATLTSELGRVIKKVRDAKRHYEEVAEHQETVYQETEDLNSARDDQIVANKRRVSAKAEKTKTATKLGKANIAARIVTKLQIEVEKLDQLLVEADVASAMATFRVVTESCRQATAKHKSAQDDAENALAKHNLHLAGILAAELGKGEPCPVCGSEDHPQKAKMVGDINLAFANEKRNTSFTQMTAIEREVQDAQAALESAKKAKLRVPSSTDQKKIRQAYAVAEKLVHQVGDLEAALSELDDEIDDASSNLADAKSARSIAERGIKNATLAAAKSLKLAKTIAEESLIVRVLMVIHIVDKLVEGLDKVDTAANRASAAMSTEQNSLMKLLEVEKFKTVSAATAATISDSEADRLQDLVDQDAERNERIIELNGKVGNAAVPKSRPEVNMLQVATYNAQTASTQASGRFSTLDQSVRQLIASSKKISQIGPKSQQQAADANAAYALAMLFINGLGDILGLETWVQRAMFEEVCEVATQQMHTLSHGRYQLTLDAEGARRRRRSGGLDLYVVDGHTGKTRPVQSLSGGEQFLTSLALALALAEVVQRYSGGLELSALFIDEGFGSLDGETLDSAMDVLRTLYNNGRTVGVITHVDAMQQELPVGIRVTPSVQGSSMELLPTVSV